jgi:hypothetical protein
VDYGRESTETPVDGSLPWENPWVSAGTIAPRDPDILVWLGHWTHDVTQWQVQTVDDTIQCSMTWTVRTT